MNVFQYIGLSTGVPLWIIGALEGPQWLLFGAVFIVVLGYAGCVGAE